LGRNSRGGGHRHRRRMMKLGGKKKPNGRVIGDCKSYGGSPEAENPIVKSLRGEEGPFRDFSFTAHGLVPTL